MLALVVSLALGPAAFAQAPAAGPPPPLRVSAPVRSAGIYHVATGAWTRVPGASASAGPDIVFANEGGRKRVFQQHCVQLVAISITFSKTRQCPDEPVGPHVYRGTADVPCQAVPLLGGADISTCSDSFISEGSATR